MVTEEYSKFIDNINSNIEHLNSWEITPSWKKFKDTRNIFSMIKVTDDTIEDIFFGPRKKSDTYEFKFKFSKKMIDKMKARLDAKQNSNNSPNIHLYLLFNNSIVVQVLVCQI